MLRDHQHFAAQLCRWCGRTPAMCLAQVNSIVGEGAHYVTIFMRADAPEVRSLSPCQCLSAFDSEVTSRQACVCVPDL
jgi:hypothetical protein